MAAGTIRFFTLSEKVTERLFFLLFGLIYTLLLVPWFYFDSSKNNYNFLPRQFLYILIALVAGTLIISRYLTRKKLLVGALAVMFAAVHYWFNKYFESHYLQQVAFLEIATLTLLAPTNVKQFFAKYSYILFYLFIFKAFVFKFDGLIHGGFLSTNLYAAYVVFFSYLEYKQKRFYNLIPAVILIYLLGSKAAFISCAIFCAVLVLKRFVNLKFSLLASLVLSVLVCAGITVFAVNTARYQNWLIDFSKDREAYTKANMISYGLVETPEVEKQRVSLMTKTDSFKNVDTSIAAQPVAEVSSSFFLRIIQYEYMFKNIYKYVLTGNIYESQSQMVGHNPHSAVIDFISRLGLAFLILLVAFYFRSFNEISDIAYTLPLLPILVFQPYGFTIGHSLPFLFFFYSIANWSSPEIKNSL